MSTTLQLTRRNHLSDAPLTLTVVVSGSGADEVLYTLEKTLITWGYTLTGIIVTPDDASE